MTIVPSYLLHVAHTLVGFLPLQVLHGWGMASLPALVLAILAVLLVTVAALHREMTYSCPATRTLLGAALDRPGRR
jgi:hypothetical protein